MNPDSQNLSPEALHLKVLGFESSHGGFDTPESEEDITQNSDGSVVYENTEHGWQATFHDEE